MQNKNLNLIIKIIRNVSPSLLILLGLLLCFSYLFNEVIFYIESSGVLYIFGYFLIIIGSLGYSIKSNDERVQIGVPIFFAIIFGVWGLFEHTKRWVASLPLFEKIGLGVSVIFIILIAMLFWNSDY